MVSYVAKFHGATLRYGANTNGTNIKEIRLYLTLISETQYDIYTTWTFYYKLCFIYILRICDDFLVKLRYLKLYLAPSCWFGACFSISIVVSYISVTLTGEQPGTRFCKLNTWKIPLLVLSLKDTTYYAQWISGSIVYTHFIWSDQLVGFQFYDPFNNHFWVTILHWTRNII